MQSVRVTSQFVTLKLTAELIARVTRRSISVQEAKEWTLGEFVYTHYQVRQVSTATIVTFAKA